MAYSFQMIPVDKLSRGRYQPRRQFDEQALEELGQSILSQGLIEPLVVRSKGDGEYEIIAGERRWRAAMLKGLHELACVIGDYSDAQAATVALIENIQREALNLIEEAQGYRQLIQEFNYTQEEIADLVGKSRSHIANLVRLLSLDSQVQLMIQQGVLSLGHARVLVSLSSTEQKSLAREVQSKQWSVRKLESVVKNLSFAPQDSEKSDVDIKWLAQTLSTQVGAPVEFESGTGPSGWLKIKYFDAETLSGLLERMGLRYD